MQKTILITRQENFAQPLQEKLKSLGINSICLELIDIEPKIFTLQQLEELLKYYLLIFTSRNAVEYSLGTIRDSLQNYKDLQAIFRAASNHALIATVGESTAIELYKYEIKDVIYPKNKIYNSESLWQSIQHLSFLNKKVAIITGDSGRDFLHTKLKESGANLFSVPVYKRVTPKNLHIFAKNIFEQHKIDIILITCKTSLDNLVELTHNDADLSLIIFSKILLVVSNRLSEEAKRLGFKNVITSENATDDSIILKANELKMKHDFL